VIIDKEKQKENIVQDDKVLLYKLYSISISSSSKTLSSDIQMLQDEINLEKALKLLQLSVKTIPFTLLNHYENIQANREKNRIY